VVKAYPAHHLGISLGCSRAAGARCGLRVESRLWGGVLSNPLFSLGPMGPSPGTPMLQRRSHSSGHCCWPWDALPPGSGPPPDRHWSRLAQLSHISKVYGSGDTEVRALRRSQLDPVDPVTTGL